MSRPVPKDLVSLIQVRAEETPHQVAFSYLGYSTGPLELSYLGLQQAARLVAARIKVFGLNKERILLLFPPGLEFIYAFLGCAMAGATAVPAPPPNPLKPKRSLQRLITILESSHPKAVLTTQSVMSVIQPVLAELPEFSSLHWIIVDDSATAPNVLAELVPQQGSDIALIQYTSGSTSDPKGAALSHQNIVENMAYCNEDWDHRAGTVVLSWLPSFHDLGLVYGILTPIWGGFPSIQMSPIDVIQRPFLWLAAMSRHRATHSGGPNFIYELCARKVKPEEAVTLDLSNWRVALTAAEPVRAETMTRFTERFAPYGFRYEAFCPGYGLSEGTCKVSAFPVDETPVVLTLNAEKLEQHIVEPTVEGPGTRKVVGCGRPHLDLKVVITNPETRTALPDHRVGEIWVSGHGVAQCYWGRPDATAEQLKARLQGDEERTYLRTGDLGFMIDGLLFITGRIKDMIIIRGTNHYPQDIESTVQDSHPSIRAGCVAAFAYEEDGEERLGVVAEVERRQTNAWTPYNDRRNQDPNPRLPPSPASFLPEEVISAITRNIAEAHGLRAHRVVLIKAGTIPKTTSGKIQRQASKRALLSSALEAVGGETAMPERKEPSARDKLRIRVTDIVSQIASIPKDKLQPNTSLHNFGIDSLTGVNIAYEVGILLGRDVPSWLLTEQDTIEKLVDYSLAHGAQT